MRPATLEVSPGDKLLLFTDGLTEVWEGDQIVGSDQIINSIGQYAPDPIGDLLDNLYEDILDLSGGKPLDDDLTIIGFEFLTPGR